MHSEFDRCSDAEQFPEVQHYSQARCRLSLGLSVVLATIVVVAAVGAIGYLIDKTVDHVEPDQDQPIPESGTLKPVGSLVGSKGEQV